MHSYAYRSLYFTCGQIGGGGGGRGRERGVNLRVARDLYRTSFRGGGGRGGAFAPLSRALPPPPEIYCKVIIG